MKTKAWTLIRALEVLGGAVDGEVGGGVGEAVDEFDVAFGELLADVDAVGDADQFGVFELDAGALVAVVEEDVDAGGVEGCGDLFAGGEEVGLRGRW